MNARKLAYKASMVAGGGLLVLSRAALAAGLRTRVDGWRRAAGLVLRGENAMFVLSAFGLHAAPTREEFASRLNSFLAGESELRVRIRRTQDEDRAEPCGFVTYTLGFAPWTPGPERFTPPEDWRAELVSGVEDAADALLNFICRLDDRGRADVWVRVNHVGADGVPVQEMLSRLEKEWGAEEVLYPTPEEFAALEHRRGGAATPMRPDIAQRQAFIDFAPLLEWRVRQNERLPEPMTFAAALLWRLARQAELQGRHMGTTVEVAATPGIRRGVGVVVIRPASYFSRPDGLAAYARDFNRRVARTRTRAAPICKTLDAAALIRPRLAACLLRHGAKRIAFGNLGLTIVKDAKVFGTPIGDAGHNDGFIAIGSVALPTRTGARVGCVTIKAAANRIHAYPALIQAAVNATEP